MHSIARAAACCLFLLVVVFTAACQSTPAAPPPGTTGAFAPGAATGLASGIYTHRGATHAGRWVMLLPGASGLTIFEDTRHYFKAAEAMQARGFDVLVVDYKTAYKQSPSAPQVPTGEKIACVVEQTLAWARQNGVVPEGEAGAIVAWSLGAEGLWPLFARPGGVESLGLVAAAAYYPANDEEAAITPNIPLLVLTGEKDDVTPAAKIRKALPGAGTQRGSCTSIQGRCTGLTSRASHRPEQSR
ncbi:MAG: hypothetical protein ACKVS8_12370 [Phycisphaerales bacterium]